MLMSSTVVNLHAVGEGASPMSMVRRQMPRQALHAAVSGVHAPLQTVSFVVSEAPLPADMHALVERVFERRGYAQFRVCSNLPLRLHAERQLAR